MKPSWFMADIFFFNIDISMIFLEVVNTDRNIKNNINGITI